MKICSLQNENLQFAKWQSVVCEMTICSLRNDNLQFAKWQSLVCKMTICSLGNDNLLSRCVYSDILNRKFPPKKPFRPENSDCAECVTFSLPRIKFNLSSGVSNRKQDLFPFYMPWRHHICIDKCHYSYRDDLPENLPKNVKSPLPVAVEMPYLNQKRHVIFKRTDKIHHCGFAVYFRTWWF